MTRYFHLSKHKIDQRIFSEQFLSQMGDLGQYANPSFIDGLRWLWPSGCLAIETSQLVVRSPYADKELALFLLQAPINYVKGSSTQKFIVKKNCPPLADISSDKGNYIKSENSLRNTKLKLQSPIIKYLAKIDRVYVHPKLPHIFTRLDPFIKLIGLERVFLGRGTFVNYRRWTKNELRDFTTRMILDEATLSRPYYNPKFLKKMISDHFHNKANYIREMGKIISFEIWHRLFVD